MSASPNLLLVRLKSIGDILFTLPAVHAVRARFPDGRITFLISQEHAPLLRGFADVDEVLTIDRELYRRKNPLAICRASLDLVRRLRRARFSLAVDFQGYGETALLTRLSGAPQRWGSVYRPTRRWAYTRGVTRNDDLHPAEWNRSLLEQCGLPPGPQRNTFRLPDRDLAAARAFLLEHGGDPAKPTLFIQPFTSSAAKNHPLDKYQALAGHWRARGVQVIFGGGPAERPQLEPLVHAGFLVSAGVPLMTNAGLMAGSALVVGGDTGLLHLAVAMGKRVLMLMRLTGPGSPVPWGHADWVLAPPPGRPLSAIDFDALVRATDTVLREVAAPPQAAA